MKRLLHHVPHSRSLRSLWLLRELDLPHEVRLHRFGSALQDPDYLARHPLGRVPCYEEGGLTLYESGAIAEHLCESVPDTPLWRPPGDAERAAWLQWLHYAETIAVHAAYLTQSHLVLRPPEARSPVQMKLETRRLARALGVVADQLAARDHLLGTFTAVDIAVGYSVWVSGHFVELGDMPALMAYLERLRARPAADGVFGAPEGYGIYMQPFYPLD
ncbi:glutathione S-transferase family protein [Oceanomicrobium pacificus]|uniref:Glutathione S-transferase family protein n=1 Tax=Oceanomicrobium pacificus TaxID=2692916 RepID=A0A6B0TUV7_9RHOB|nr:glutathione S-transferase family protein [Oceanomicrobium pacificus]MXU65368.1 glutathione S-transferase family protein [Oceanomicrobium pacificus]